MFSDRPFAIIIVLPTDLLAGVATAAVLGTLPCKLVAPQEKMETVVSNLTDDATLVQLHDALRRYVPRGGSEGLRILLCIVNRRLMGSSGGPVLHDLVDKFMATYAPAPSLQNKISSVDTTYGNHAREESNMQKARQRNRGDVGAMSTGRREHRAVAVKAKAPNFVLSGRNRRVDKDAFSLKAAIKLGLLDSSHQIYYVTPFTAPKSEEQEQILCKSGLMDSKIVGLDLEWSGPRYPTTKTKGVVYDASLLVLSCQKATVLFHLYQFQDPSSEGMHWPGPYISKFQKNGQYRMLFSDPPPPHTHNHTQCSMHR